MNIRPAKIGDWEVLTDLFTGLIKHAKIISPALKTLDKKNISGIKKYAKKCINTKQNHFLLLAEIDGEVAGFINFQIRDRPKIYTVKKIGYVNDLFVAQKYRKKSVGKSLMNEATKLFKSKGIKHICLNVLSGNKSASGFYEKHGFTEFKRELIKTL
ncbi:Mycothiol acetyltransferase [uncultured archaeon]|nr:Mycothiol acetyltransferase [uncultured archaeon]